MLNELAFVDEETLTNAVERGLQAAKDMLERDLPEVFTGKTKIKVNCNLKIDDATGTSKTAVYRFEGFLAITEDKPGE